MKPHLLVICSIFAAFACPAFGYDILLNTNFADGTAHWKDDPNATACLNAKPSSDGVNIPLSSNGWSKIEQSFNTPESVLALNVSYSFSDDAFFAPNAVLSAAVVRDLTGISVQSLSLPLKPGEWIALIVDPQARTCHYLRISASAQNPRSITALFKNLLEHEEKTLYLIFPPGAGSVTVSHASLDLPNSDQ